MTSSVAAITEDVRTDLATGYEPVFTDRPAQLRHPLVPATFTVSSTVDGSIVSNVIDMTAHARLLLNRGRGPDGPILSEAMFDVLTTPFVERTGRSGDLLRLRPRCRRGRARTVDRPQRRHGRLHGVHCGRAGERAGRRHPAERVGFEGRAVVNYAFDAVRACITDAPLARRVGAARAARRSRMPIAFAGEYARPGRRGRASGPDGCRRAPGHDRRGIGGRLERDPLTADAGDLFLVVHPSSNGSPSGSSAARTVARGGLPRRSMVPRRALRRGAARPGTRRSGWRIRASTATTIPGCRPCAWCCGKGRLALQFPVELSDEAGEAELQPLEDGWFSAGEPWVPRRIRLRPSGGRQDGPRRVQRRPVVPLVRGLAVAWNGSSSGDLAERDARVVPAEPERVREGEP